MVTATPLSTIIALARAGALDHAWYEFSVAGYDRRDDDPAALTVKGRLLKDRALRSAGEERRRFYMESADAYRRSADLRPGTYPLINAATLALLAGDRDRAEAIAREVLDRIEREPEEPETPYWRAATQAEALLILGREDEARAALEAAVAAAPRAWEDHASTLRQFIAIQQTVGADADWLDLLRPPAAIHFAARLIFPERAAPEVAAAIAAVLDADRVGFGYGAPTAGVDLMTAEALVERGAELHVVLPGDTVHFARVFVDPFGEDWRRRFDALLAAAESIESLRPLDAVPDETMARLAEEIALGAALLNAERLMGEVVPLNIGGPGFLPPDPGVRYVLPPEGAENIPAAEPDPDRRSILVALLAVGVGSGAEDEFEVRLEQVREVLALADAAAIAPYLSGDVILIGYAEPHEAAEAARALHARLRGKMPLRLAGHYGLTSCARDPFSGTVRPTGRGADLVKAIAAASPPDTVCVSGDFAAVLAVGSPQPFDANLIGELQAHDGGSPITLYALRPAGAS